MWIWIASTSAQDLHCDCHFLLYADSLQDDNISYDDIGDYGPSSSDDDDDFDFDEVKLVITIAQSKFIELNEY